MKTITKNKIPLVIILGIIFGFSLQSSIFINFTRRFNHKSLEYSDEINFDNRNLKDSEVSGIIHIDDANPSMNWFQARDAGICTGNGTFNDPYVIEDLIIIGGFSGSCILIENSEVYFRIENCTLYRSGGGSDYAGIRLQNVTNSYLINNNCSTEGGSGIYLDKSKNNTISGNTAYNNRRYGIRLRNSDNNIVSGNTVNNNTYAEINVNGDDNIISGNSINGNRYGIFLNGINYTITGNIMNECGLEIIGNFETMLSHEIDTTNLVNGKRLYYYTNQGNLSSNDFTNAGQVILVNCHDSLISNLNVSYTSGGISLYYSNNNIVSGNTANYNIDDGIYLNGDNNTISGNTANYNTEYGIYINGDNNTILGNTANYNNYRGIFIGGDINIVSGNTANNNDLDGIRLSFSNNNIVSGNTANSNIYRGISIYYRCYNNIVLENILNNNTIGIYLYFSDFNTILGNVLIGNEECIVEENCEGNRFVLNYCGKEIPLEWLILMPIISVGAMTGVAILLIIRYKRRKVE